MNCASVGDDREHRDPSPGLRPPSPRCAGRGATRPQTQPWSQAVPPRVAGTPALLNGARATKAPSCPSPRATGEKVPEGADEGRVIGSREDGEGSLRHVHGPAPDPSPSTRLRMTMLQLPGKPRTPGTSSRSDDSI